MKKWLLLTFVCFGLTQLTAQITLPQLSPLQKIEQRVGLTDITIEYSRPSRRGRVIFGELEKYGDYWRTGANRNTKITFSEKVKIGATTLESGTYALFTKPTSTTWTVYFYTDTSNWNVPDSIATNKIAAQIIVPSIQLNRTIESLTLSIDNLTQNTAELGIAWENTYVAVPIDLLTTEVMDKKIEEALKENALGYHFAGYYYLRENIELEKAKKLMETAIQLRPEPDYRNHLQLSYILDKLGDKKGAIKSAQTSLAIAKKIGSSYGIEENSENLKKWGVTLKE